MVRVNKDVRENRNAVKFRMHGWRDRTPKATSPILLPNGELWGIPGCTAKVQFRNTCLGQ